MPLPPYNSVLRKTRMSFAICFWLLAALAIREVQPKDDERLLVRTRLGYVRGSVMLADDGSEIRSFRSIPYAEPTLGKWRFLPARPKLPWKEGTVWDATKESVECIQISDATGNLTGVEDCLFLNVYSPQLNPGKTKWDMPLLPVLVFIHRGLFIKGSGISTLCGPQRMIPHGVLLVTMNYRIGALGFLSTEDTASPGNYGMKDQIQALRWIKDNIHFFGGNPQQVTLFGQSAGAQAVLMHMTSPLGTDLFHGVIGESGACMCDWTVTQNPLHWAKMLSDKVGCPTYDTMDMVECFRKTPADVLVLRTNEMDGMKDFQESMKFQPTLEPAFTIEPFMTEWPLIRFQQGQFHRLPVLMGVTKDEGYKMLNIVSIKYNARGTEHMKVMVPSIRRYLPNLEMDDETLHNLILQEYFKGNETAEEVENLIRQIYGDSSYFRCTDEGANVLAAHGTPTYIYKFMYKNETSFTDIIDHMSELQYLFKTTLFPNNLVLRGKDIIISDWLITLWKNFAKTGRPTFDSSKTQPPNTTWEPTSYDNPRYYQIDLNPEMVDGRVYNTSVFWDRLDRLSRRRRNTPTTKRRR